MNEPKKRGRPTNAEREAKAKLSTFPTTIAEGGRRIDPNEPIHVYVDPFTTKLAQAYALRVWHGQSVSLPRNERIRRCIAALEGQNLPTEGVEYPE